MLRSDHAPPLYCTQVLGWAGRAAAASNPVAPAPRPPEGKSSATTVTLARTFEALERCDSLSALSWRVMKEKRG